MRGLPKGGPLTDRTFVLAVPSSVFRARIESRYLGMLTEALSEAGVDGLGVHIEVRSRSEADQGGAPEPSSQPETLRPAPAESLTPPVGLAADRREEAAFMSSGSSDDSGINPRYTFDDFVTGTSNRFAHAAALAVAETPARSYNPLFIYGDAGLGKTHLLQAIAHYVREHYPNYVARYVTTQSASLLSSDSGIWLCSRSMAAAWCGSSW